MEPLEEEKKGLKNAAMFTKKLRFSDPTKINQAGLVLFAKEAYKIGLEKGVIKRTAKY